MLKGRGLLLAHPASNPHYLTRILDFYAVHWIAFDLDQVEYDPDGDKGRLLTPLYVKDVKESFGGQVCGWGEKANSGGLVEWLGLDRYLIVNSDGSTLSEPAVRFAGPIPIVSLYNLSGPPAFVTYALAPAECLLEMTDMSPEKAASVSQILRRSAGV